MKKHVVFILNEQFHYPNFSINDGGLTEIKTWPSESKN